MTSQSTSEARLNVQLKVIDMAQQRRKQEQQESMNRSAAPLFPPVDSETLAAFRVTSNIFILPESCGFNYDTNVLQTLPLLLLKDCFWFYQRVSLCFVGEQKVHQQQLSGVLTLKGTRPAGNNSANFCTQKSTNEAIFCRS